MWRSCALVCPFLDGWVVVILTPQPLHHFLLIYIEFWGINLGKIGESEGPAMKPSREGNCSLLRIDLHITQQWILISCHNDICIFNHMLEGLICLLTLNLHFQKAPVHLVHCQHRPNPLTECLSKYSLCLHTDSLHTIYNHQCTICDAKSSSHLRWEIHMPRWIYQVDEIIAAILLSMVILQCRIRHLIIQWNPCRLDGDASLCLICPCIHEPHITSHLLGNDTSSSNKWIRQGWFSWKAACRCTAPCKWLLSMITFNTKPVPIKHPKDLHCWISLQQYTIWEMKTNYIPWSTWAITDIFLILCFLSIISRNSSEVNFTCNHHD